MAGALMQQDANATRISFQSKELELLLNVIDKLRAQGIGKIIDLPQMIVCGDQSSGKSSVLEAISGVRFPTKDNLCTRFPTELILRRGSERSPTITIVPDAGRPDDEKTKLAAFKAGSEGLDDFGSIVDDAGKAMGLDKNTKVFSNDVLRVELSGPSLPHLTLVDLPGLFHAGNKSQSAADAEAVKGLVKSYMKKPRSIILAVVSAKNDYANQIVTKYAHDVDPTGERTLGIITKPDTLHPGSESEKQFFELAENKDVVLRLGWHVLRNRDYNSKDCSLHERDQAEAEFFSQGIWTSLTPSNLGVASLKPRLSRVLKEQILTVLPNLTEDVQSGIKECEVRLERLGTSRATAQEQRAYLHKVSQAFCQLVQLGVAGYYNDDYFAESSNADYPKRIRAVVANLLDDFAEAMRLEGMQYYVRDEDSNEDSDEECEIDAREGVPIKITRSDRLEKVAELLRENRGRELPGFTRPEVVTTLFKEQCQPWENLVKSYTEDIFGAVRTSILLILEFTADHSTGNGILQFLVNPALDAIKADLDAKVAVNLRQHTQGHPITFNHYFTDNVQKLRNEHQASIMKDKLALVFERTDTATIYSLETSIDSLVSSLTNTTEADMNKFACSEALHFMEAYYKVALKFFVDDFSIHTVEEGLLAKVHTIFEPNKVLALTDEEIAEIAGESEEARLDRASLSAKLEALREALRILRQLDRARQKK